MLASALGHVAFLFMCLPGLALLVSALFRWRRNISFRSLNNLSLHRICQFFLKMYPAFLSLFPLGTQHFSSFISKKISLFLSHRFGPCIVNVHSFPLAMRRVYSIVFQICQWPGLSLVVSALLRRRCSISIHVFPRFLDLLFVVSIPGHVASPRSVSVGVRPFPLAHVAFPFICLPGLFVGIRPWPGRISIYVSPRSAIAGVRPFPLAMQDFFSFPK